MVRIESYSTPSYPDGTLFGAGDLVAFSGISGVSKGIKIFTHSKVSHVGILYDPFTIVESTSLNKGHAGVVKRPLSDAIGKYQGCAWIFPLRALFRQKLNEEKELHRFAQMVDSYVGKDYDYKGAAFSGLDILDKILGPLSPFQGKEKDEKYFCSEVVLSVYEDMGFVHDDQVNTAEVTPMDAVTFPFFNKCYFQVAGPPTDVFVKK